MKVSKKSWHYRLYRYFTWADTRHSTNVCRYLRFVVIGILSAFIMVPMLTSGAIMLLVIPIINIFTEVQFGSYEVLMMGSMLWIIAIMIGLIFGLVHVIDKIQTILARNTKPKRPKPPPSMTSLAWRRFKEKTCFFVTFE